MTIDGVTIDDTTDIARLVDNALHGRLGSSRSATDVGPLEWMFRAWPQIRDSKFWLKFGNAVAYQIATTDDPEARLNALLFITRCHDEKLSSAVTLSLWQIAVGDRKGFRGVYPSSGGSADLEWWLLHAIAAVSLDDGSIAGQRLASGVIRNEALAPDGKVEPILHTLISNNRDWFAQHREEILQLHPEARELAESIEAFKDG